MKKKLFFLAVSVFFLFQDTQSQVSTNIRVYPSVNLQVETPLCISGHNEQIMAGASVTGDLDSSGYLTGFYRTTNGGLNWSGQDSICDINGQGIRTTGNPQIVIDKDNNMILSCIKVLPPSQLGVSRSTNNGQNWSPLIYVPGVTNADKDVMATDDNTGSPFFGNTYIAYAEIDGNYPVGAYFSKSTNGGLNWSTARPVSSTAPTVGAFPSIAIGNNGEVYITWTINGRNIGLAKSTDGGSNWKKYDLIINGNEQFTFDLNHLILNGVLVNAIPTIAVDKNNGNLYIVCRGSYTFPGILDHYDIVINKSTDKGESWTSKRVNQDSTGVSKFQIFPAINIDKYSGINVTYYDDRNSNDTLFEVYLSRSVDGGNTFKDYRISNNKFKLKTIQATGHPMLWGDNRYIGSYTGLVSNSEKIQALWFDNSLNNNYQTWSASFKIGPFISHIPLKNTTQVNGNYTVNCSITPVRSPTNPAKTILFWSRSSLTRFNSVKMTQGAGNNWTAQIPANGSESEYLYYIKTEDMLGNIDINPDSAHNKVHKFVAGTFPTIAHTPLTNQPKENFPSRVEATISDISGINSAWVVWNKNGEAKKQFNLSLVSSNLYSGLFNESNGYVNLGDRIFYKIFAKDNSSIHNIDSTALYSFYIENSFLCENFVPEVFPPVNWAVENNEREFLTRVELGYQDFNGSVKFDFFKGNQVIMRPTLITSTFNSSSEGNVLRFEYAHAERSSSMDADTLIIETSSDNGATYSKLTKLFGRELNTALAQDEEFIPDEREWSSKEIEVPSGTNKIRFQAGLKDQGKFQRTGNNLYIDNICVTEPATAEPFSIKVIPQGFYNTNTMALNSDNEEIQVTIRHSASPYLIAASGTGIIDQHTFTADFTFPDLYSGSYYIEVKHWNSIETWSKFPINYVKGNPYTYDFTNSIDKAFGNNLILVGNNKYSIYSGDIDQDGNITLTDVLLVFHAAGLFTTGDVVEDLNGDLAVTLSDVVIATNNSNLFVTKQAPNVPFRPVNKKRKPELED